MFLVFALGIIGTGLLALPVLGSSAAYAVGRMLPRACRFGAQAPSRAAVLRRPGRGDTCRSGLNFTPLDPVKALFWSAVIKGLVAMPVMVIIMLLVGRSDVMGPFRPKSYGGLQQLAGGHGRFEVQRRCRLCPELQTLTGADQAGSNPPETSQSWSKRRVG